MKKLFIGIDFSKQSFDASFFESGKRQEVYHFRFENNKQGYQKLLNWIKSISSIKREHWLFCGEHTGLYSIGLTKFLLGKKLFMWLENPLQIKRSSGIKREKTDKTDSLDIAIYAYRFQDKARVYELPDESFRALENLLSFRDRLIKNKCSLEVSSREMRTIYKRDKTVRYIYEQSMKDIERINKEVEHIEDKMLEIINSSGSLKQNYYLAVSVKGIGMINALTLLVCTQNFTSFDNSRKFASYGGIAPFECSSGTSLNKGRHISYLAKTKIKALLTQAAKAAVVYDPELKAYFERKLAQGKHWRVAINNVRNKLIARVFAVVRNKQPYQKDYMNQLACLD